MTGALANKIFTQKDFFESFDIFEFFILFLISTKFCELKKKKKKYETPENLISIKSIC